MNPTTVVEMDEDSYLEMETTQIRGVDSTVRTTKATPGPPGHPHHQGEGDDPRQAAGQVRLYCGPERRGLPHQRDLPLCGPGPVPPRCSWPGSTAMPGATANSSVTPSSWIEGVVAAIPEVTANCVDASLVHEAAIGKIARGAAHQADDPGPHGEGGRGADRQGIFEVNQTSRGGRPAVVSLPFSSGCGTIPEKSFERGVDRADHFILTTARCPNRARWSHWGAAAKGLEGMGGMRMLATTEQMRELDRTAIEERGDPLSGADGERRPGGGPGGGRSGGAGEGAPAGRTDRGRGVRGGAHLAWRAADPGGAAGRRTRYGLWWSPRTATSPSGLLCSAARGTTAGTASPPPGCCGSGGYRVRAFLVGDRAKMTPDARAMEEKLKQAGGALEPLDLEGPAADSLAVYL